MMLQLQLRGSGGPHQELSRAGRLPLGHQHGYNIATTRSLGSGTGFSSFNHRCHCRYRYRGGLRYFRTLLCMHASKSPPAVEVVQCR